MPDRKAFGGAKVARIGGKFKGSEGDSHALEQAREMKMTPSHKRPRMRQGREQVARLGREEGLRLYSWSWRLSDSTSSDSAVSLETSASILRTACSTVV
jgi:hypothetical protein